MGLFTGENLLMVLLGLVVVMVMAVIILNQKPLLHKEGALRAAVNTYIYGYLLVTLDMVVPGLRIVVCGSLLTLF